MAERPSNDWFRSAGWTRFETVWLKRFGDYTAITRLLDRTRVYWDGPLQSPAWLNADPFSATPADWEASWEAEQKRRETPLDPDGWQHFPGCSIHLAGGYRINQWHNGEFGAYEMPHKFCKHEVFGTLESAIAYCNRHAKENGVNHVE